VDAPATSRQQRLDRLTDVTICRTFIAPAVYTKVYKRAWPGRITESRLLD
jgi:hypothetical protein